MGRIAVPAGVVVVAAFVTATMVAFVQRALVGEPRTWITVGITVPVTLAAAQLAVARWRKGQSGRPHSADE